MNILVIGSGGREHALVWKIAQSRPSARIFCAPGNAGTAELAENVPIKAGDIQGLLTFAREQRVDLTVVGPEQPLVDGIVDVFQAAGLRVFGPDKNASQLEGSKIFTKDLLKKYNIPTADFEKFIDASAAIAYIKAKGAPIVVKADGLAAGKGVTVAMTVDEATTAVKSIMDDKVFGSAGNAVVIEEYMDGEEASILAFCDGETVVPMTSAQDHKRIYDNDQGPNTGGMGAYSPAPVVTADLAECVQRTILEPTVAALRSEGITYKGILYAGLMITAQGPKVVEYNVRFGDPETQVILPRLDNDLVDLFTACIDGTLNTRTLKWKDNHAICVVVAAGGYPGSYRKGVPIEGLDAIAGRPDTVVFHAGTAFADDAVVTAGGRVLNVVSLAPTLRAAIEKVYADITLVSFEEAFYRRDIGAKGLRR